MKGNEPELTEICSVLKFNSIYTNKIKGYASKKFGTQCCFSQLRLGSTPSPPLLPYKEGSLKQITSGFFNYELVSPLHDILLTFIITEEVFHRSRDHFQTCSVILNKLSQQLSEGFNILTSEVHTFRPHPGVLHASRSAVLEGWCYGMANLIFFHLIYILSLSLISCI